MNLRLESTALCVFFLMALARSDDKSARIDALFADSLHSDVPGASVVVIQDAKVIFEKAYGLADVEHRIPNTPVTNFRLASLTKQFTAMAVMILAEQGKLSYDDTLARFFPELPSYAKQVTLRQMLHHTSGLPDYEDAVPANTPAVNTPSGRQLHERDVFRFLKTQDHLLFIPGSEYRYSNTGYVVLGMVVEKVSGRPLPAFLKQAIFDPLGMRATVMHVEGSTTISNRAYGYSKQGDAFVRTDQSPTSATLGDGAIYSSVDDLVKWDRELYAHSLVSSAAFQQAITPGELNDGKSVAYGFGWQLAEYQNSFAMEHSGTTMGFHNFILRVPDRRFTVIVLMNRADAKPDEIAHKICDMYLANP